jgi:hypothetical protein
MVTNASLLAVVFGMIFCIALCIYGCTPFGVPLPQGRPTDSMAISSACHQPLPFDCDAQFFRVQYGIVPAKFYPNYAGRGQEVNTDRSPPKCASVLDIELRRIQTQEWGEATSSEAAESDGYLTFTTYRHICNDSWGKDVLCTT